MPWHDWTDDSGWDGFHMLWITHLFHAIKPRLPGEFRAYLGSVPALGRAVDLGRPDVAVRHWLPEPPLDAGVSATNGEDTAFEEPDVETATMLLDPQQALYITYRGRMVAALELISPRNKDRMSAQAYYLSRYLGYLREGVHLLLVDVHRRPLQFSFADAIAAELQVKQPATPAPLAVAYRVSEPAAGGGRLIAIWRRPLTSGATFPALRLPLTVHVAIPVNLEETYMRAAADVYLA
jgi:hypothetical protein